MHFIFDIDGTISFKGQPVSAPIMNCLARIQEAGHIVGFASARPCRDMLPVLDKRFHHNLLIGANGAMTYFQGERLASSALPQATADAIMSLLHQYEAAYLVDDEWNYAHNLEGTHPFLFHVDPLRLAACLPMNEIYNVIKILVLGSNRLEELTEKLKSLDTTLHYHSAEGIVDMTSIGVNKMAALRSFGIIPGQFVCFGNDMNDIPMFQQAGYSVAIGSFDKLLPLASCNIPVDSDTEERIIAKLEELAFGNGIPGNAASTSA
ncbi:HAD-IIB family hydrolase [Paenibacillus sp.]|uniref:HAD-IIB family hydrolase n=1 Tax=Paenibacillus sp. TaxID=58172 RepID=UPI003464CC7F